MLILKHVEYEIKDSRQLDSLLTHIRKTTSQVKGMTFKDIYFVKGKKDVAKKWPKNIIKKAGHQSKEEK